MNRHSSRSLPELADQPKLKAPGDSPAEFSPAEVEKTYQWYAPLYDRLFGAVLEPGRRILAKKVSELAPRRLLEVGVGTGLLLPAYPADCEVVGVDLSEAMLDVARQRAARMPDRVIRLIKGNGERLDFADGQFDCVTLPYVLSVTPDPDAFVREVRRVCKPGGHIVLVNHFSGSSFWWGLERMVAPLAARIGFRSTFSFERHVLAHDWKVLAVEEANLFSLSKVVVVENSSEG